MIVGYVFFWMLIGSAVLVGLNRMADGLVFDCKSCTAERYRKSYCSHCGVIGNPVPEPVHTGAQQRSTVRFE